MFLLNWSRVFLPSSLALESNDWTRPFGFLFLKYFLLIFGWFFGNVCLYKTFCCLKTVLYRCFSVPFSYFIKVWHLFFSLLLRLACADSGRPADYVRCPNLVSPSPPSLYSLYSFFNTHFAIIAYRSTRQIVVHLHLLILSRSYMSCLAASIVSLFFLISPCNHRRRRIDDSRSSRCLTISYLVVFFILFWAFLRNMFFFSFSYFVLFYQLSIWDQFNFCPSN